MGRLLTHRQGDHAGVEPAYRPDLRLPAGHGGPRSPRCLLGGLGQEILGYGLVTWAWLAFAGVPGAALAYLWFYEGIRKIGPSRTGTFISLVPICTVLLAWLLLGEPVEMSLALGAGMVTAGLVLTNQRPAELKPAGGVSR